MENGKEKEKSGRPVLHKNDKYREGQGPHFTVHTPLNVDKEKIIDEALNVDLIPTLRKVLSHKYVDPSLLELEVLNKRGGELFMKYFHKYRRWIESQ